MKKIISRPLKLYKNHKKKSIAGLVVLALVLIFIFKGGENSALELTEAQVGSVLQEVSITGKVVSAQSVNLSFEQSGRIIYVGVKSGQRVRIGQTIIYLDAGELLAQKQRELANVKAVELRLAQVSASNDLNILKTSLENSEQKLNQTRIQESTDRARSSLQQGINAMVTLTDLQMKYFNKPGTPESNSIATIKEQVLNSIYNQDNLGWVNSWYFLALKTGLNEMVLEAEKGNSDFDYEKLLRDIKSALVLNKDALTVLISNISRTQVDSIDKATANSTLDSINNQIALISSQEQAIISAKNAVNDARTRLESSNTFDLAIAQTDLERAKASLALVDSQLTKYSIRAPFAGIATNIDVKVGQVVGPSTPAVTLVGDAKFQIETNISEADIAKIKVGNEATVTLDAYGKDQKLKAKVIHIDPAGRTAQDVVTYKVTLEFSENDSRLLSGLTADVDILTNKKDSVVFIPSRDVITKDDKKFVKIAVKESQNIDHLANFSVISDTDGQKILEVPVQIGLRGSDGRIEIVSGIKAGDMIVSD